MARSAAVDVAGGAVAPCRLAADTDETDIAAFVDTVRKGGGNCRMLLELLPEEHAVYAGRGANETARIRGYALSAFAETGLPDAALPYVLEELESGREPYLVAAAAMALRGWAHPTAALVPYLSRSVENIRLCDDAVSFDCYRPQWPLARRTTAMAEIRRTLDWINACGTDSSPAARDARLVTCPQTVPAPVPGAVDPIGAGEIGPEAGCCDWMRIFRQPARLREPRAFPIDRAASISFEDQDGRRLTPGELFRGKPSVVVFFYTRCENPNKCSLAITKLAWLRDALRARGLVGQVRTTGITYDPEFDLAQRLKSYGMNRALEFDDDTRLVRTVHGFDDLLRWLQPGVNFGPATVNRHRIELFVLDGQGRVEATFSRLQWQVDAVLDEVARLRAVASAPLRRGWVASPIPRGLLRTSRVAPGAVAGLILAVAPKCPLCLASYLGVLGMTQLANSPYVQWVRPTLLSLLVLNLAAILVRTWPSAHGGVPGWFRLTSGPRRATSPPQRPPASTR